jgi:hypothetical protein
MEPDFSGYATMAGLKCTDGRTITPEAFKHQDQMTVPLVWQHGHSDAKNVLGHVDLEFRDVSHPEGAGIYGYGYFNDTEQGENGRKIVAHGDVKFLSIWANELVEKVVAGSKQVLHGAIREVSLVLAGANPGAKIDYVRIAHSDDPSDVSVLDDEAIITTGLEIQHETPSSGPTVQHSADDPTLAEVYDSLSQVQKDAVNYMIGAALEEAGLGHSALDDNAAPQEVYDSMSEQQQELVHSMIESAVEQAKTDAIAEHSATNQEGTTTVNVFEQQGAQDSASLRHAAMYDARRKLTPDRIGTIIEDAERLGSLKESFLAHAAEYGIDNIDVLFPDARLDQNGISIISRRMEWVQDVLTNTRHSPFSRVKSFTADITAEEARARGYIKGTRKKDEVLKMLRRVTTPKTIYKKQKLDRDDILDITELDIVAWLKAEMRVMLDEELARAILVSDGREVDDEDKIDEDHVRPIAYDDDLYTIKVRLDQAINAGDLTDAVVNAMDGYKGSGNPTLYITQRRLTGLMLQKDTLGRRLYNTKQELANALMVRDIVAVEAMESNSDLIGVIVNLTDYTVGSDRGGDVAMFDDFDIDFNQQKYLIETRVSGALTKPKSAIALFVESSDVVTAPDPTFNATTGVLTVPSQTGVVYLNDDTGATLTAGAQSAIAPGATINVTAAPASGYGLAHDSDREWSFTRDSA